MRELEKARQLLAAWGLNSHPLNMVLYAMLEEDWSYDDAVEQYAAYCQCTPEAVVAMMQEAVEKAVEEHRIAPTAERICLACYDEARRVCSL